MLQIVPAILATSEKEYQTKINRIVDSRAFENDFVQVDFADKKFVDNLTVGAEIVKKYPVRLRKEAHLMVEDPVAWVQPLSEAGFFRCIAHVEVGNDQLKKFFSLCQQYHLEPGLAVNPETLVEYTYEHLSKIHSILVMSVNPGFGGQQFLAESIDRVKKASRYKLHNKTLKIGVDGGIKAGVVADLVSVGADYLVIGSRLLEGDVNANLEKIWEQVYQV